MASPEFVRVQENEGGTFIINPGHSRYHGTVKCLTCVGVFFRVDDTRVFLAHINGSSKTTYPDNLLTDKAGKNLAFIVKQALLAHAKRLTWDPTHPQFGKNVKLVCGFYDDVEGFKRAGKFVVDGIKDCFRFCSNHSLKTAESVLHIPNIYRVTSNASQGQYAREVSDRFRAKSAELLQAAENMAVTDRAHGLIVSPLQGTAFRIGNMANQWAQGQDAGVAQDLGYWRRHDVKLMKDEWAFTVYDDDHTQFPPWVLNDEIDWTTGQASRSQHNARPGTFIFGERS